ncbi:hypothetical protein ORI20_06045 [Mycobacterium sp. CVI_P3]|uniref:Uncharacterized protein n=1 Tax=Mycobacterium pinniadriaticum TaxID=2994102 RepID=A0ABT3SAL4_9MYCO|nr:hypothetical protein [Mycobacterium pinniadriaticum]MCX2929823.1 hypothetical protein [Mycobacterium pinniadriaticum]MCX2936528.1 hypothetical protein [Mycobacterium pinniadriaticum]
MDTITGPDPVADTPTTRPLHLGAEQGGRPDGDRRWVSAFLGALGIVVLGVLVTAVVTVSHESSDPDQRTRPSAPVAGSTAAVTTTAAAPSPATQSPTRAPASWSATATAATEAAPPPVSLSAPKSEPSVRQRLHDMFPRLFPGH